MNINGNVSRRAPVATVAYDWPELTVDGEVMIWRGTRSDPRRELVMRLEGGAPDEIMEYLLALADSLAPIVAFAALQHAEDQTADGDPRFATLATRREPDPRSGTSTLLSASREFRGEAC